MPTSFAKLWKWLNKGDVLLSDRGFCSFLSIASLLARGVDSVMRLHQAARSTFAKADAWAKTVDAHILAQLLRGNLVSSVHITSKESRQRKEVLRQRYFFVRQRTMLRNRIHRLLGGQHGLRLPQCSDLSAGRA